MANGHDFYPPTLREWVQSVKNDPAPTWIVKDLIPSDNLVLISGHPKDSKKTWLGMWLALRAAAADSKVLYIYREGARRPTLQRFDALVAGLRNMSPAVFENIHFHHRGSFWLDDAEQVKNAVKFVKKHDIKLIFIDTFAKSVMSDENSSKDVGRAIHATERLRDAGATVVLIHHLRKAGHALSNGTSGTPEPDKDLRGSSALAGAYETHLAVRSYQGEPPILLVGGKEAEWRAFSYSFNFIKSADDTLEKVTLELSDTSIPNIGGSDDE
jgi:RecA-family ATPase